MPTGTTIALAGASIAGPVLGGIIGAQRSAGDRAAAQAAAQAAYNEILRIGAPPDLSKQIIVKHFQQAGLYTPQLEQQINAGISQVSQIQEDPALRDSQMGGLNLLKQRAEQGGLNATDRANLNQIRQQAAIDQQGKLEAIRNQMAARGQGGSGAELAQELGAASSSGADESASADRLAAQAQQAALSAAMQSGQLGGQIRSQDFANNQAKAEAADKFKLFDTQNSIARQQRNVGAQNQGQLYNLNQSQNLSNANTQMDNAELYRENAAQRQYWQDQAQLGGMKSNALLGQAQTYNNQADATARMYQGMGSGVGAAAGAGLNYMSRYKSSPSTTDTTGDYGGYDSYFNNDNISGGGGGGGGSYSSPSGGNQMRAFAHGGEVEPCYADGGQVDDSTGIQDTSGYDTPSQQLAPAIIHTIINRPASQQGYGSPAGEEMRHKLLGYAEGGHVSMQHGGNVPGQAIVPGDSYLNDTVDAKLSPGEVVIPREVVEKGPDAGFGYLHALLNHKRK